MHLECWRRPSRKWWADHNSQRLKTVTSFPLIKSVRYGEYKEEYSNCLRSFQASSIKSCLILLLFGLNAKCGPNVSIFLEMVHNDIWKSFAISWTRYKVWENSKHHQDFHWATLLECLPFIIWKRQTPVFLIDDN